MKAQQQVLSRRPNQTATTPVTAKARRTNHRSDPTLSSSPAIPAPELHAEIFSSPQRRGLPTPGISVLTPATNRKQPFTKAPAPSTTSATAGIWDSDSDLDDSNLDNLGHSPPKTMQFHIPQSRLLKTPAKEASKRIVEDILLTAGIGRTPNGKNGEGDLSDDDIDFDFGDDNYDDDGEEDGAAGGASNGGSRGMMGEDTSPSVIRKAAAYEDESF